MEPLGGAPISASRSGDTHKSKTFMLVRFRDIPAQSTFAVFDEGSGGPATTWTIPPGDFEVNAKIPRDWRAPFRVLRCREYFIPQDRVPIEDSEAEILISGDAYYLDVNREAANEERNRRVVERLIHQLHGSDLLDGRQKFYISLISLQSYFEFLVHGMLVLAGHVSMRRFNELETHKRRTAVAFDDANTDFFSTNIEICPGKEGLGAAIETRARSEAKGILDEIRTLRNKVVHAWGYKDVGRDRIRTTLEGLGEQLGYHESDDAFYAAAAYAMVRLYARIHNMLAAQLSYFIEKEVVRAERASRGY